MGLLSVYFKGKAWNVKQEIGLGIREHDDVMLSMGLSWTVHHDVDIPAGQYVLIRLRVPEGLSHHAENRYVEAYNNRCQVWVIPNYEGSYPAGEEELVAWNQRGPIMGGNKSIFSVWAPQAGLPIDFDPALDVNKALSMDHADLEATAGTFFSASSSQAFESLKGRYYYPNDHLLLVKNGTGDTATFEYIYGWHEF